MSAKQNRIALAELREKIGSATRPPVDLEPWLAGVRAVLDARRCGRPYSMVPRDAPAEPGPAVMRLVARLRALRKALEASGDMPKLKKPPDCA
jgi:hypothetical protein